MATKILTALGAVLVAVSMFLGWSDAARTAEAVDDSVPAVGLELTVAPPKDLKDVPLAAKPSLSERGQAVAANPKNPNLIILVLDNGLFYPDARCLVRYSSDAGRTWSESVLLPDDPNGPGGGCGGPAVAYAPDGKRVYAAYSYRRPDFGPQNILVSGSDDNGATWQTPVVALDGHGSYFYGSPRIATPLREADAEWVYVTAHNQPDVASYTSTDFARSADRGTTWSAPRALAYDADGENTIVGGGVAGGLAGEILVTWYNLDFPTQRAVIEVVRSRDHGATFAPRVIAAKDPSSTSPDPFHRFASPEVKIGYGGAAHLVYPRSAGLREGDAADIGYVWSPGPPYRTWAEPVTVNDDGLPRAQVLPSLATQRCGASTILHLVWQDARLSSAVTPDQVLGCLLCAEGRAARCQLVEEHSCLRKVFAEERLRGNVSAGSR